MTQENWQMASTVRRLAIHPAPNGLELSLPLVRMENGKAICPHIRRDPTDAKRVWAFDAAEHTSRLLQPHFNPYGHDSTPVRPMCPAKHDKVDEDLAGIPEFWLSVMNNQASSMKWIKDLDKAALKIVTNIRMKYPELPELRTGKTWQLHLYLRSFLLREVDAPRRSRRLLPERQLI